MSHQKVFEQKFHLSYFFWKKSWSYRIAIELLYVFTIVKELAQQLKTFLILSNIQWQVIRG